MTEIGKPDEVPEIEVAPLEDPVPREVPREIPIEPFVPVPEREPDLVPA